MCSAIHKTYYLHFSNIIQKQERSYNCEIVEDDEEKV